jgi:hypothetical protein
VDILNQTAREISPNKKLFQIDCNWFMLMILYNQDQPLAHMTITSPASPGGELQATIELLGKKPSRPIQARLKAPSLKLNKKITLPGSVHFTLAKDTPAGTHLVTLDANGLFGARSFVTIAHE